MTWAGPECPNEDCGSVLTPATLSSRDNESRPIRKRRCNNCGTVFVTIETTVWHATRADCAPIRLAKFSEVDDIHQDRNNRTRRTKFGWSHKRSTRKPRQIHGTMVAT